MNILELIEKGAGMAASFAPPPYNTILAIVGGLSKDSHTQAANAGIAIPSFDLSMLQQIIPEQVLKDLLDGKKVSIEIDGAKIKSAIESLAKANAALADLKSAFSIKS